MEGTTLNNGTIIIGHYRPDMDCAMGIALYKAMIDETATIRFFDKNRKIDIPKGTKKIVFIDTTPNQEFLSNLNERFLVEVFDHHERGKESDTATSLVVERIKEITGKTIKIEREGFSPLIVRSAPYELSLERIERLSVVVDKEGTSDDIDIARVIGGMHGIFSEIEIYEWGEKAVLSELAVGRDRVSKMKCAEFFRNCLLGFLKKKNDTIKADFARTLERLNSPEVLENQMSLVAVSGKVVGIYGEKDAKEWMVAAFKVIEAQKKAFREQFGKVKYGIIVPNPKNPNLVIATGESESQVFGKVVRTQVQEAMKKRHGRIITPIIVQWQAEKKNGGLKGFQIYSNGHNDLGEVVKAVRAELLRKRGIKRNCYWKELVARGEMKGADPLFYNSGVRYPGVFWGTLKHPKKEIPPFSVQELVDIIVKALDRYFPEECKKSDKCRGRECPYFLWKLFRCKSKQHEWKNSKVGHSDIGESEETVIEKEARENGIKIREKREKKKT
ncbi:hypothetical protein KAS79_02080 [Candidatus Parcubacteria bacterium]|nr:hypothetical protein [Candidatus Parcubacteria bacterium]